MKVSQVGGPKGQAAHRSLGGQLIALNQHLNCNARRRLCPGRTPRSRMRWIEVWCTTTVGLSHYMPWPTFALVKASPTKLRSRRKRPLNGFFCVVSENGHYFSRAVGLSASFYTWRLTNCFQWACVRCVRDERLVFN